MTPPDTTEATEPKPDDLLSPEDFNTIVRLTPLVSIDLVVRSDNGAVWLGRRNHKPAQGIFFVPGGRIRKNETLARAFARLSMSELGIRKRISDARFLGVFEHFYPENRHGLAGFGTHYVVLAYELTLIEKLDSVSDEHHECKRWWSVDEMLASPEVHPNSKAYVQAEAQ